MDTKYLAGWDFCHVIEKISYKPAEKNIGLPFFYGIRKLPIPRGLIRENIAINILSLVQTFLEANLWRNCGLQDSSPHDVDLSMLAAVLGETLSEEIL